MVARHALRVVIGLSGNWLCDPGYITRDRAIIEQGEGISAQACLYGEGRGPCPGSIPVLAEAVSGFYGPGFAVLTVCVDRSPPRP